MTQVGHLITGVTMGVLFLPERKSLRWKTIYFIIFGLLAIVPDFQIKYWGHHRYYISHSLFVNALAILVIFLLLSRHKGWILKLGGWSLVIGGSFAWLSHMLLDTFYNHGKGLLMFWPFSDTRLALPIAWFSVVTKIPSLFTWDTARILLIEFVSYGTLLLFVIFLKRSGAIQWVSQHIFRTKAKIP